MCSQKGHTYKDKYLGFAMYFVFTHVWPFLQNYAAKFLKYHSRYAGLGMQDHPRTQGIF